MAIKWKGNYDGFKLHSNSTKESNYWRTNKKIFICLIIKKEHNQHVLGVAMAAEKLALQYQEDIRACIVAALLHDISAVITPQDMMKIAKWITMAIR